MTASLISFENQAKASFLNIYQIQCENRKKIFSYLYSLKKKWPQAFPAIQTIAEKCGCSRATVKRTLGFFEGLGWLFRKRRCYRSNVYMIDDEILKLNIYNKATFRLDNSSEGSEPMSEPVYIISHSVSNLRKDEPYLETSKKVTANGFRISEKEEAGTRAYIAKYCKKPLNLTSKDVSDLFRYFMQGQPQSLIQGALDALNNSRQKIPNPIGYLFSMCAKFKRKFLQERRRKEEESPPGRGAVI